MRLEVRLKFKEITLPIDTQSLIQGMIYHSLEEDDGHFYHDKGFQNEHRQFKMFTFSKIFGKYKIHNKQITFYDHAKFYISSIDSNFIRQLYQTITNNQYIQLSHYKIQIDQLIVHNHMSFETDTVCFQSISPLCLYSTDETGYSHYYDPFDHQFEHLLQQNIKRKYEAYYHKDYDGSFHIESFEIIQQGVYTYKKLRFKGFFVRLMIKGDPETLSLIYETGLGLKTSSGFGMLEVK